MKIKLLSDLHLEGFHFVYEYSGEDVLVLAGDIHTRNRLHEFLDQIPKTVTVLFVAGNHEYYYNEFHTVNKYLSDLQNLPNFVFLKNDSVKFGDVNFFGGTMYTEFMLTGMHDVWFAKDAAKRGINDFYMTMIQDDFVWRNWSVEDHINEHKKFVRELEFWLKTTEGQKRVVISHFAPHPSTINEKYAGQILNGYFTEDMNQYLGWEGLWLYGHTHSSFDGYVGETRLISNPKGYGKENKTGFNPELIIEI